MIKSYIYGVQGIMDFMGMIPWFDSIRYPDRSILKKML